MPLIFFTSIMQAIVIIALIDQVLLNHNEKTSHW